MKIIYQFRWWLVVIGGLLGLYAAYVFDISPLINQISELTSQQVKLNTNLKNHREKPNKKSVQYKKIEVDENIARLSAIANVSDVLIEEVVIHANVLHLQLRGHEKQLIDFIAQLNKRQYPGVVTDYVYQMGKMKMEVALLPEAVESKYVGNVSLMRMVAYIKQGERRSAMLVLPSGEMIDVSQGSVVGEERGMVEVIEPDRVEILLPNGDRVVIRKSI